MNSDEMMILLEDLQLKLLDAVEQVSPDDMPLDTYQRIKRLTDEISSIMFALEN